MTAASDPGPCDSLSADDAAAGFALSAQAGWNQTADDWRQMIEAGTSFAERGPDRLIATTVVLPYEAKIAWIAMVLTDEAHRGQGRATANLRRALARCREQGWRAGLDAAPPGRPIYRRLGLREVFGLHRLLARKPAIACRPDRITVRPLATAADFDAALRLDAAAFGAERRELLNYLRRIQPDRAKLALVDGRPAGCVFARPGRLSLHVGPLIADDPRVARDLLAQVLDGVEGAVSIDVPDAQTGFLDQLGTAGFLPVRPFTRMIEVEPSTPGDPARLFALAGPEFG